MSQTAKPQQSYLGPLIIIGVLFFIFGFVTWVNSVLIVFFKNAFQLSTFSSNLVATSFFISYALMAIPSSWLLKKTGFKMGMSFGLVTMAVGTLIFVPAAKTLSYPLFLVGLFLIGIGLTILQTASNPYVTILGPRESAAQRISFMGVANKLAGITSQLIFGSLLLSNATTDSSATLEKVVTPYMILTGVLIVLAIWIRFSNLPEVSEEDDDITEHVTTTRTSVWQFPNLVLGILALFCYVGAEVISGDTIINYGLSIGFSSDEAKYFTAYTLYGMLAGYILGIVLIPKVLSQQLAMRIGAILGIILSIAALLTTGFTSVLCVALIGFANAPIWPAIWPLALNKLGKFTKLASALLIMGITGGALLPLIHGYLTDTVSPQLAYGLLIPLYAYILFYALIGHKKQSW
ncbi:sugar MFS transporter [Siphonobacter sp. SORGH_AS_1065]|uniref:sugar MFS transporter n=1 Tax=Siphonobacter sp. SORGH_AS_1065 TaxID=3041795 RepID=UPI00278A10AC|nr:sugar MFS transporter [Siphonobacter sp. SORGH_AS_1065]MDQ1088960.1 FHS family L-fucose permease-like MFS transporter [Siphonobacter sp. SORGH_AS_1065]